MRLNQVKWGAILSYVLIVVNTVYGLLITPFVIRCLGMNDYGVYKTISSLSASLAVVDLGLGVTMTRYMATYHAKGEKEEAGNFAAMVLIQQAVLSVVIIAVGAIAFFSLPAVYGKTMTAEELTLAKQLFAVLVLNMLLRLTEGLLLGIASGYEHFVFSNGMRLASLCLRIGLLLILLPIVPSALTIGFIETALIVLATAIVIYYVVHKIGIIPKLKRWDGALFKESMGYTALMFIQTIVIQFNGNVDNILVGAKIGVASVAIYSMALLLFNMYEQLSSSIAGLMLPNMAKRVAQGQNAQQLQASVEKAGRYQFVLLGAALSGFVVLGKEFFSLWLGNGYEDCYGLSLILMIPVTFPMMQNVALSILRAQNKMGYRTITLAISCCVNIIVTLVGIHYWGYWGAAIGTASATVLNLILMNCYYKTQLKFNIFRLFWHIMDRIWICAVVAGVVTAIVHHWLKGSWISFVLNAMVFMVVYGIGLMLFGLSKEERKTLIGRFAGR